MTTEEGDRIPKCTVRDGKFVVPCTGLSEIIEGGAAFSKAKGIRLWEYYDMKGKRGRTRAFVGVKCKAWPDGFLFNFCPICGTDISSPFAEQEEPASEAAE